MTDGEYMGRTATEWFFDVVGLLADHYSGNVRGFDLQARDFERHCREAGNVERADWVRHLMATGRTMEQDGLNFIDLADE